MAQSNWWLLGVCMPMMIGYGSALLWTLAFDVYSVCVYGNYEIVSRYSQTSQVTPVSNGLNTSGYGFKDEEINQWSD